MKKLILICGPNGVGKSTACRALTERMENTAYVDSDWCRCMHPFSFTDETVGIVASNMLTMLTNYFRCSYIENVVFQYGFHGVRRLIFDDVLAGLHAAGIEYAFRPVILDCSEEENVRRMTRDGRDGERIERAVRNTREIYEQYDYPRIDTTRLTAEETVDRILGILGENKATEAGAWAAQGETT